MGKVRLYGVSRTNTSWGRVTAGVREGLEGIGGFAGFVPVDDLEDDAFYAGADAPTAIFVGPPSLVGAMTSYGMHEQRYAIVAPNSDWLPERLIKEMMKFATIVAPSTWGAYVVGKYTGGVIPPYRHGVSRDFESRLLGAPRRLYDEGGFRVLHLASTHRQRKGTRELILAWRQVVAAGRLGERPELHIVVDAPQGTFPEAQKEDTIVFPWRQLNAPGPKMCEYYQQFNLVCQPSRAEGFGLSPLEALASGVPVCATICTGHAEYLTEHTKGLVVVRHGPEAPVDDAPEGEVSSAPTVPVTTLAYALAFAYANWIALAHEAFDRASRLSTDWSWPAVTEQWLKKEGIKWT